MPASSRLTLQVKNSEEKRDGRPDPQEAACQLECPKESNRIRMELGRGQVQMAEHPGLEITEKKRETEIPKHDLVHWKPILGELRADSCIDGRPRHNKILMESRLTIAVFDGSLCALTMPTMRRGNPSRLVAHPIQRGIIDGIN